MKPSPSRDARPGSPEDAAHSLGLFVMIMTIVNTFVVFAYTSRAYDSSDGVRRILPLFVPLGSFFGGIAVAWGIDLRWRWAWFVSVFAFGSIPLFGLAMTGMALLLVGLVLGAWPLSYAVKSRSLFLGNNDDEDE